CWKRAMRSRDIWVEVAEKAGIPIEHAGLCVAARRPEAARVLEAFMATDMGAECRLMSPAQAKARVPGLRQGALTAALWSPHERRIESRTAIPRLASWLEQALGVTFLRSTLVIAVEPPRVVTTLGAIAADTAIVCPGHDFLALFPDRIAAYGLTTCKLQMLRVAPGDAGFRLGAAVMSDPGLVRYLGYAELPHASAPRARPQPAAHAA